MGALSHLRVVEIGLLFGSLSRNRARGLLRRCLTREQGALQLIQIGQVSLEGRLGFLWAQFAPHRGLVEDELLVPCGQLPLASLGERFDVALEGV